MNKTWIYEHFLGIEIKISLPYIYEVPRVCRTSYIVSDVRVQIENFTHVVELYTSYDDH